MTFLGVPKLCVNVSVPFVFCYCPFSLPFRSCALVDFSFSAQLWTIHLLLFRERCVLLLLTSLLN